MSILAKKYDENYSSGSCYANQKLVSLYSVQGLDDTQ